MTPEEASKVLQSIAEGEIANALFELATGQAQFVHFTLPQADGGVVEVWRIARKAEMAAYRKDATAKIVPFHIVPKDQPEGDKT